MNKQMSEALHMARRCQTPEMSATTKLLSERLGLSFERTHETLLRLHAAGCLTYHDYGRDSWAEPK